MLYVIPTYISHVKMLCIEKPQDGFSNTDSKTYNFFVYCAFSKWIFEQGSPSVVGLTFHPQALQEAAPTSRGAFSLRFDCFYPYSSSLTSNLIPTTKPFYRLVLKQNNSSL